jgi:hypothetical protein
MGMEVTATDQAVNLWLELFTLLRDERGIFDEWRAVIVENKVKGKGAHDARLVAAMKRHGLSRLLTFNVADFARYNGIEVTNANLVASDG